ncbi:hypothetical protein [Roseiconus lacunae]|uniref:hypothetical protein n=1 Tax=Roseiconus lacunae TaxID=2605694 RepID=UPI001E4E1562|nr:hypothetical protein [Roseiconus lacunae]MCD0459567.1 hypothetical protein [Roseiconus lacunae]
MERSFSQQNPPPEQLSSSTATPTMHCLVPKELIGPLKKLGRTDWFRVLTHPEGHRFELDHSVLNTLVDHPAFLQMLAEIYHADSGSLIQLLAYSKLLANGPKIVQPTTEQCEALIHVDLNLKFRDYEQPFPAIVVELPFEIRQRLTSQYSLACPRFVIPYFDRSSCFLTVICAQGDAGSSDGIFTVFSRNSIDEEMEIPLRKSNGEAGNDFRQVVDIQRIAINLSLLLTRYGFENNGPLNTRAYAKQLKASKSKSKVKKLRARRLLDSSFSAISLSQDIQFVNKTETALAAGANEGSLKSPHWRRGHFRKARVGTGRTKTRLVFVRPSFINGSHFSGELSDTQYRIRTEKAGVINSA